MKSVLIVDDEVDTRHAIQAILEMEGYTTLEAGDGKEALEILSHKVPDLILLDIMLPYVSGFQVLNHIRNEELLRQVPVIMMSGILPLTAMTDPKWQDFLQKPFDMDALLGVVSNIFANPNYRRLPIHAEI